MPYQMPVLKPSFEEGQLVEVIASTLGGDPIEISPGIKLTGIVKGGLVFTKYIPVDFGEQSKKIALSFHTLSGRLDERTGYYVYPNEIAAIDHAEYASIKAVKKSSDKFPWKHGTQKAEGVRILELHGFRVPTGSILKLSDVSDKKHPYLGFPKFARPCPVVPRHGFVDSRVVNSWEELYKVRDETLAADPEGEIMLMTPLDAEMSGIWTPGQLTLGKGNDGATAGKKASTIPVGGVLIGKHIYEQAHVKTSPYVELVWRKSDPEPFFVQLRDGPVIPNSPDFIPKTMKVNTVILADGDLLEWESKVKTLNPDTDVVWHPGGSLASHYAVHCVVNGITILTSKEPKVGDKLEPNTTVKEPSEKLIKQGFVAAMKLKGESYQRLAQLMLCGLHNSVAWMGSHDFLIGAGMGAAFRLTLAACLGELRHAGNSTNTQVNYYKVVGSAQRDTVYQKALTSSWPKKKKLLVCFDGFYNLDWPSNYGGYKWAKIAWYGLKLYDDVRAGDIKQAMMTYNTLVNLAHNSSWAFDKFVSEETINEAAENNVVTMLCCTSLIYRLMELSRAKAKIVKWDTLGLPEFEDDNSTHPFKTKKGKAMPKEENENGDDDDDCDCEDCKPWLYESKKKKETDKLSDGEMKEEPIIAAQIKKSDGKFYVQVRWSDTERQSYFVPYHPDLYDKYTKYANDGIVVLSMAGSGSTYVPLTKNNFGNWELDGFQLVSERGEALYV